MGWVLLMLAGLFEVVGVLGMNKIKQSRHWNGYIIFVTGIVGSFALLSMAMRTIPMGTAYAIWTGIGTVGGALVGMVLYGESKEWRRMFFIGLVLAAVVGLKLIG